LGEARLGWELVAPGGVVAHYLLGADAPFGTPTLRLVAPQKAAKQWKHVESDGTACLLEPGQSWTPLVHEAAVYRALRALVGIITLNLRDDPGPDLIGARHRWVDSDARALSLLDLSAHMATAVAARRDGQWIIASTREQLMAWLANAGADATEPVECLVVHAADFSEVPRDIASLRPAAREVLERGGLVVYSIPTEVGPMLLAVRIRTSGELARYRVDRADRPWLHERGGVGLPAAVADARVAIVGCGSLGAGIAEQLLRAGVGRLTLVDPDSLSWDNVARHLVGGESVGQSKVRALMRRFRAHLPSTLEVSAFHDSWQRVAEQHPEALRPDLIVGTMAAWPEDLALAEWSRLNGIPLILGWVEARAAAGHALYLREHCLGCLFTPQGLFSRTVALWPDESPIRLVEACHEHYLPYGYADIAPTQVMISRLALEVLVEPPTQPLHRAIVPSPRILDALGARPSPDYLREYASTSARHSWIEDQRSWAPDAECWHCGGSG
jgi:hypothetical protein